MNSANTAFYIINLNHTVKRNSDSYLLFHLIDKIIFEHYLHTADNIRLLLSVDQYLIMNVHKLTCRGITSTRNSLVRNNGAAADKLVQPVPYLTAYEHGVTVFDSLNLKRLPDRVFDPV